MKKFVMGIYSAYAWKGENRWGKKTKGIIVADCDASAESEARRLGMTILSLKKRPYWMLPGDANKKIKVIDIVFVMRQLSTLISAGIPLVQSLEIIASGVEKVKLRALVLTIRDDVSSGKTFAEALGLYPQFFNPLICGLINAGEQSGTLDRMVSEIASYLEYQEQLKNRVKRALYYPITVLVIAILICLGLLLFLVPRFEKIYASFNAKLPAFTLKVIDLSHFVQTKGWILIVILAILIYLHRRFRRKSQRYRMFIDNLSLHTILFGSLIQKAIIARVASTVAITLGAGIPLIEALSRVSKVANNEVYQEGIHQVREQVTQGESISLAMRSTQLFPPMVTQMIEIGEKSGALDQMFNKVGEYYRDQVNTAVEGLTTMIEPLMIVFVGALIGVFMLAMYLPIFNLGMAIK